ncbi:hypothetical protein BKH43_04415 [Helicobacter sp. 13S00401-1]|uniref:M24 family metallopeptidase n=1 Tax=Helicobacter sp. 13S00401-1 TaxID=1905758 RepID=UPI000BA6EB86|nr:M24 family metallopeptidase [Helicobacter sp. 13S00401-1]PAF50343.1 hypothetical protein BKH43_04415 [Helicobacter sp. 13S00401-1]
MKEVKNLSFITRDESAAFSESGFSCDNVLFLKNGDEGYFITDSRYTTEAKEVINASEHKKCKSVEIIESKDLLDTALSLIKKQKIKTLVFDPLRMSASEYLRLKDEVSLKEVPNFTQKIRAIKAPYELDLLKHSQSLNKKAYKKLAKFINTFLCEASSQPLSEQFLWFKMKSFLEDKGNYPLSFDPIVAINGNAAKPHALPSKEVFLKEGDCLLVDAGLKYERYCSDRTRSAYIKEGFKFKEKQSFAKKEHQKIYDLVKKAKDEATKKARSGMKACELDAIARDIIEKGGYGKYFIHSLGHGIGLDIHEEPFITARSETILEDNMVFSIEPGIYLPGEFGIRIEDLVVLRDGRAEIL